MTVLEVPPGCRVAIIGDLAGHAEALRAELTRLGVPEDGAGRIPPDLRIVQVGDLVHRGPDSAGVVALIDRHLHATPSRWTQLVGNHEAFYLRRRQFSWPERVSPDTVNTLRRWWADARMVPAVAIRAGAESFVATHAGVTRGFWRDVLGSPRTAVDTVRAINALVGTNDRALFRYGALVNGVPPDPLAGPVWALAGTELTASWLGQDLPFSQVHGHTSLYDWDTRRWYVDATLQALATRDEVAKHVTITLRGGRLVGVDPGCNALTAQAWRAFVVTAETE